MDNDIKKENCPKNLILNEELRAIENERAEGKNGVSIDELNSFLDNIIDKK